MNVREGRCSRQSDATSPTRRHHFDWSKGKKDKSRFLARWKSAAGVDGCSDSKRFKDPQRRRTSSEPSLALCTFKKTKNQKTKDVLNCESCAVFFLPPSFLQMQEMSHAMGKPPRAHPRVCWPRFSGLCLRGGGQTGRRSGRRGVSHLHLPAPPCSSGPHKQEWRGRSGDAQRHLAGSCQTHQITAGLQARQGMKR